ncbi:MAG: MATE family efflux transporter [Oscillospiraceae bacterium]|nr:MATE family efflux transporter [Oscillospiraceae bacterium]
MAKEKIKDLTQGSPLKLIIKFVIPIFLGYIFQQFYSMVDSIIVGKILGPNALAGVGSTGAITFLVLGFCSGVCTGFTIPISHCFGKQDFEGLRKMVGNIVWLSLAVAAIMTVAAALLCGSILTWMHNPKATYGFAFDYLFIVFLGIPAIMLYNLLANIIRALGDSKTPLYFLIISSIINIILDIVLILWTPLGVKAAALATVISQAVSAFLCLMMIAKRFSILHLNKSDLKLRSECVGQLLSMGIPMGLQFSVTAIGSIILQSAVNNLGPVAMAAVAAGDKVCSLMMCPMESLGIASATFAGQNVGAGKLERVHSCTKATSLLGLGYSAFIFVVALLFGDNFVAMFMEKTVTGDIADIITKGHRFLIVLTAFYPLLLYIFTLRNTIQGMGFSGYAIFGGLLELVGRAGVSLLIIPAVGFSAVSFAPPAAWLLADAFFLPMYFICLKKLGYKRERKNKNITTTA